MSAVEQNGIEGLAPPSRLAIVIGGEELSITPAAISDLGAMLRDGKAVFVAMDEGVSMAEIFSTYTEDLITICAHGSPLTREQVSGLSGCDFMTLLGAVLEANLDFFIRRLRPAMDQMMTRLLGVISALDLPQQSSN